MFKNYLRIALRNLQRKKGFAFINVAGLAIGLACVILIAAWTFNELSYDRFNSKYERIFRVVSTVKSESETLKQAVTSPPLAKALQNDYPEIQNTVRLDMNDCIVRYKEKQFQEDGVLFADSSFFNVFTYPLVEGNISTALNEPYSIVITKTIAKKYFGNEDPVGKTMILYKYDPDGNGAPYKVTGVTPDPPQNAHFTFNIIASFNTYEAVDQNADNEWFDNGFYTYLLLRKGANAKELEKKLPNFAERHLGASMQKEDVKYSFALQPLKNIHLYSDLRYEIQSNGNIQTIYIFATIGLFILLIACINYMNLSTARSLKRAKEVGVKKVLGADKFQLVRQFLVESTAIVVISSLVALLLVELLQPVFFQWTGEHFYNIFSLKLVLLILCVTVLTGFLAGIYPAFFISAFGLTDILKGSFKSSTKGILLRKGLIIVQFAIAIILLTGILVVKSQLDYIRNKNLGFDKESLFTLKVNGFSEVRQGIEPFRNKLLSNSEISGVSVSRGLIGFGLGSRYLQTIDGKGKTISTNINLHRVDRDFLKVYNIDLIAGRNFTQSDSQNVYIVNQAAVRMFGWGDPQDALNKTLKTEDREGRVIGVVKDFNFAPLKENISPVMIRLARPHAFSNITVRLKTADLLQTINFIKTNWKKYFPNSLLDYSFMDQKLAGQYKQERLLGNMFMGFVILSLIIASLGLFGLSSFSAEQRTKEIGIRKVLGASVTNVSILLSKDFLKLVLLANFIAWPVAYYVMNKWLQGFAYRININWWMFALSGGLTLIIALTTVSYQVIKAATGNPVESIKYE